MPYFDTTFIEVKGPAGVDAPDAIKMRRVVQQHPQLLLTVWDARVIETLEDTPTAAMVARLVLTYQTRWLSFRRRPNSRSEKRPRTSVTGHPWSP